MCTIIVTFLSESRIIADDTDCMDYWLGIQGCMRRICILAQQIGNQQTIQRGQSL